MGFTLLPKFLIPGLPYRSSLGSSDPESWRSHLILQPAHKALKRLYNALKGLYKALRGLYKALRGLYWPVKGCIRPLKGCIRPLKGCIRPLTGLIRPLKGCLQPFNRGWRERCDELFKMQLAYDNEPRIKISKCFFRIFQIKTLKTMNFEGFRA